MVIVNLYCDSVEIKSKDGKTVSHATTNKKKLSLCRAEWKKEAVEPNLPTIRSKAAYAWLMVNNPTYAHSKAASTLTRGDYARSWQVNLGIGSISPLPIYYCMNMA